MVERRILRREDTDGDAIALGGRQLAGLVDVRLIRHGQTRSYSSDSGLTAEGRDQVWRRGLELAATVSAGAVVALPYAPTARAAESAEQLHRALVWALGTATDQVKIAVPVRDAWFDNFRLWCHGQALEPTVAFGVYREARAKQPGGGDAPPWFDEMDRFARIQAAGHDPISYWLTQPVQHFEPAASTVRRFWAGLAACTGQAEPEAKVFVSTHSGCMRAVAAAAFGRDPGEPDNAEDVRMLMPPGAEWAWLSYRGETVRVAAPPYGPPWWQGQSSQGEDLHDNQATESG